MRTGRLPSVGLGRADCGGAEEPSDSGGRGSGDPQVRPQITALPPPGGGVTVGTSGSDRSWAGTLSFGVPPATLLPRSMSVENITGGTPFAEQQDALHRPRNSLQVWGRL